MFTRSSSLVKCDEKRGGVKPHAAQLAVITVTSVRLSPWTIYQTDSATGEFVYTLLTQVDTVPSPDWEDDGY